MSDKKRDYYDVLDINKSADQIEIKRAFREKAMMYHPDRNKAANAEDKFKEVNEAYSVLSNPKMREKYDRFGHQASNQPGFEGFQDFNFNGFDGSFGDIFESFFGGRASNRPRKGRNLVSRISITFNESYHGKKIKRHLTKFDNNGRKHGEEVTIDIPAGIQSGQVIIVSGFGQKGINGGPNGDLQIQVYVLEHHYFERKGNDIHLNLPISIFSILREETIMIPTLDETQEIVLDSTYQVDEVLYIKNRGFPDLNNSNNRGNLVINLNAYVPKLTTHEKEDILKATKKIKDKKYSKWYKGF